MKKNYNILYSLPFAINNGLLLTRCTALNSMLRNARFFSSTNEKGCKRFYSNIKNVNETIYILTNVNDKAEFFNQLKNVLSSLDKSFKYNLEYCLYLHTNDQNKNFKEAGVSAGDSYDSNPDELLNYLFAYQILEANYKFKGYSVLHSDLFNKDDLDMGASLLNDYIKNLYNTLGLKIIETNENLNTDEFIEFKRPLVLIIRAVQESVSDIKQSKNSNNSNKIVVSGSAIKTIFVNNNSRRGQRSYSTIDRNEFDFQINRKYSSYGSVHSCNLSSGVPKSLTLDMFSDDLIDLLNVRLKKGGKDKNSIDVFNQEGLETAIFKVQRLMKNAEFEINAGRSGALDTRSWFLRAALSIVNDKDCDTWEKQVALEMLSLHYESKFIEEILKDIQAAKGSTTKGPVFILFSKCLPYLIKAIQALVDGVEYQGLKDLKLKGDVSGRAKLLMALYILGFETVASIVFSNLVRVCGSAGGIEEMELINQISKVIFINLKYIKKIDRKLPVIVSSIWAKRRDDVLILSPIDKIEVGQTLVDICLQCCHELFRKVSVNVKSDEKINWIVIRKEFLIYLSDFAFNPIRLPMLHKPNNWSLDEGHAGGYLYTLYNELVNSKGLVHHDVQAIFKSVIGEDQINAVNYLNAQQFEVNSDMLDFLLLEWEKDNGLIFGKYNKPSEDDCFNSDTQKHNSLYWMYRNILNIAQLFRGKIIYLPVFMDFRGRIYPLVNYLSYQGGDVARSLLNFHCSPYRNVENKHILIYLCNVFGNNKYSMNARVKWSQVNLPRMIFLYENDRDMFEVEYLGKAKEKAQFMSCFLALYRSQLEGHSGYKCSLPVLFDATCSGMQHLSGLTTDLTLAPLVNLTNGDLKDFYGYCADIVRQAVSELPNIDVREQLMKVKINRKLMKLPVMTIPYNIGLETLTEKITDKFVQYFEGEGKNAKLRYEVPAEFTVDGQKLILCGAEAGKLGSLVYHTVKAVIPPIQPLKDYFKGILKVLSVVNQPIFWITPLGMKVWGSSLATTPKRVKTSFLKSSKPVTIRIPSDNYDYKVINRSLMANFIHSMDAANIHYLIKIIMSNQEYKELNINLYTIHDCFASVNDQMDIMESLVRKAFTLLYFERNYLKELDACLLAQIRSYGIEIHIDENGQRFALFNNNSKKDESVEIPKLPDFNWEINKDYLKEQVMRAEYFIS